MDTLVQIAWREYLQDTGDWQSEMRRIQIACRTGRLSRWDIHIASLWGSVPCMLLVRCCRSPRLTQYDLKKLILDTNLHSFDAVIRLGIGLCHLMHRLWDKRGGNPKLYRMVALFESWFFSKDRDIHSLKFIQRLLLGFRQEESSVTKLGIISLCCNLFDAAIEAHEKSARLPWMPTERIRERTKAFTAAKIIAGGLDTFCEICRRNSRRSLPLIALWKHLGTELIPWLLKTGDVVHSRYLSSR